MSYKTASSEDWATAGGDEAGTRRPGGDSKNFALK